MSQKYRMLTSEGGPDTAGCWQPYAAMTRVDINDYTDSNQYPVYMAPKANVYSTVAGAPTDILTSSGYIQTLSSLHVLFDTAQLANLTTNIYFSLYRAGAQIGSARIGGWSSGATPAFAVNVPQRVPFYTTNTTALTGPPNSKLTTVNALCRMKPFDVITIQISAHAQLAGNMFVFTDVQ